jgi:outer membrane murein-binding lipoprotein Lpp
MSTAGKVLTVLVMLVLIGWVILASGVSRVNTNYNTKLNNLQTQVEKLSAQVTQTQLDVTSLTDQTAQVRTQIDLNFALLRSREITIQKTKSQILETLLRLQYELAIAQDTAKSAQSALDGRNNELQTETKELSQERATVQELIATTDKLTEQLTTLRKDFKSTYQSNLEILGKVSASSESQPGRTN